MRVKKLIFSLMVMSLISCESNLKVKTVGGQTTGPGKEISAEDKDRLGKEIEHAKIQDKVLTTDIAASEDLNITAWTENGSIIVQLQSTLENSTISVFMATDADCSKPQKVALQISSKVFILQDAVPGNYHICASARKDDKIISAFNNGAVINVKDTKPSQFALVATPRYTRATDVSFTWAPAERAVKYQMSLNLRSGCLSPIWEKEVTGTQVTASSIAEGDYFVCVFAKDKLGNSLPAANNDQPVTFDRTQPGPFSDTLGQTIFDSTQPALTWQASAGASSYKIVIASNSGCTSVVQEKTTPGLTWTSAPLAEGNYYLCVTASDESMNLQTATPASRLFSVSLPPAASVTGIPSGLSTLQILTFSVSGTAVSAYKYKFTTDASQCASSANYSEVRAIAKNFSLDQTNFADGPMKVCVLGIKADGVSQKPEYATIGTWTKDNTVPYSTMVFPPIIGPKTVTGSSLALSGQAVTGLPSLQTLSVQLQKDFLSNGCLASDGSSFNQPCPHWTPLNQTNWNLLVDPTLFSSNSYYSLSASVVTTAGTATLRPETKGFMWEPFLDSIFAIPVPKATNGLSIGHSDMASDGSGNVYLVSYHDGEKKYSYYREVWIRKFAANGVEDLVNWNKPISLEGISDRAYVAVAPDGSVYVAGTANNLVGTRTYSDWWIKKFTSAGVEVTTGWNKSVDANSSFDSVTGIAVDSLGNVIVAGIGNYLINGMLGGASSLITYKDWWIKKYSPAGTQLWEAKYDGYNANNGSDDIINEIATDSQNNIFVVGSKKASGGAEDWWLKKLTPNGVDAPGWDKTIDSGNLPNIAKSIVITPTDDVWVGGYGINLVSSSSNQDWWIKKFDNAGTELLNVVYSMGSNYVESVESMTLAANGDLIVLGSSFNFVASDSNQDWVVKRLKPDGTWVSGWSYAFDGNKGSDTAVRIRASADKSLFFVAGNSYNYLSSTSGSDGVFKTLLDSGVEERFFWEKNREPTVVNSDRYTFKSFAYDADNNYYVTGCYGDFQSLKSIIRKFTSTGVEITTGWPQEVGPAPYENCAEAISIDPADKSVYVGGTAENIFSSQSGSDVWIRKYTSNGTLVTGWNKNFDLGNFTNRMASLNVAPDGSLYALIETYGYVSNFSMNDVLIKKFSSSGVEDKVAWNKVLTSSDFLSFDRAAKLSLDAAGNVYVGSSGHNLVSGSSYSDWRIVKYSPAGTMLYTNLFDFGSDDYLCDIAVTPNGQLLAFGSTSNIVSGSSNSDWVIRGYDATTGNPIAGWSKAFDFSADDHCGRMAVDASSNVFVIGTAQNQRSASSGSDIILKKFSSTGFEDPAWARTYDANFGEDAPIDMTIANGKVHIFSSMYDAFSSKPNSGMDSVIFTLSP